MAAMRIGEKSVKLALDYPPGLTVNKGPVFQAT